MTCALILHPSLLCCSYSTLSPIISHLVQGSSPLSHRSPAFFLLPTTVLLRAAKAILKKLKSHRCPTPAYISPWFPITFIITASLITLTSKLCHVWSLTVFWILTLAHHTQPVWPLSLLWTSQTHSHPQDLYICHLFNLPMTDSSRLRSAVTSTERPFLTIQSTEIGKLM